MIRPMTGVVAVVLAALTTGCTTVDAMKLAGKQIGDGEYFRAARTTIVKVPVAAIIDGFTLGGILSAEQSAEAIQAYQQSRQERERQLEEQRRQQRQREQQQQEQQRQQQMAQQREQGPRSASDRSQDGIPLRGIVSFELDPYPGSRFGSMIIHAYVAGRGESEIRRNAEELARIYAERSTWSNGGVSSLQVKAVCKGPGFVVEARIDPSTYAEQERGGRVGFYAGCFQDLNPSLEASIRRWESEAVGNKVEWYYHFFSVGYVDERNFRGGDQYEAWIRSQETPSRKIGIMRVGSLILDDRYLADCNEILQRDKQLRDMAGCLRHAVGTLKSRVGLR